MENEARFQGGQSEDFMLENRHFTSSIVAFFAALFVMLVLWPFIALQQRGTLENSNEQVWDVMLSISEPKQRIRSDKTVYNLKADRLQIITKDSDQILLTRPYVMVTQQDGSWMEVSAKAGLYNKQSRVLQLIADVRIQDQQGGDLHTQSAVVRMASREAEGHSRIHGKMNDRIVVDASGFRVNNQTSFYEFFGATQMLTVGEEERL